MTSSSLIPLLALLSLCWLVACSPAPDSDSAPRPGPTLTPSAVVTSQPTPSLAPSPAPTHTRTPVPLEPADLVGTWQARSHTEAPVWSYYEDGSLYSTIAGYVPHVAGSYQLEGAWLTMDLSRPDSPEEHHFISRAIRRDDLLILVTAPDDHNLFVSGIYERRGTLNSCLPPDPATWRNGTPPARVVPPSRDRPLDQALLGGWWGGYTRADQRLWIFCEGGLVLMEDLDAGIATSATYRLEGDTLVVTLPTEPGGKSTTLLMGTDLSSGELVLTPQNEASQPWGGTYFQLIAVYQ